MTRPAYLISHTHWDREWYRTFQQFRLDLVRTIDIVLDTLKSDPSFVHFLLDGQTIVIDDYLAMRPGRAGDLRRQIADGRLSVGPWYCHPDLFLVSGESIVRNLMLGVRMAQSYGRSMMVGYIPDQFGHTGQLPQIFRGFGIESAVLWRGVNARETRNESWWEAPDGSRVFLELLAQSYSNAQMLPLDPAALADRMRQLCDVVARGATGSGVLIMNGGDHQPIQAGLPHALAEANHLLPPEWRVEQVGLEDAVTRLRDRGHPEDVLRGELRSPATAHLLPGVLSARIPLKRRNVLAQLLLEREAEPYAAWATLLGAPYPLGELWVAWRLLLQCQPHDSICGCSIDQVHREMETRFDGVEQIGEELIGRSLGQIIAHIDTSTPESLPANAMPLVVINPSTGPRSDRVRVALQFPGLASGYDVLDASGNHVPHRWLGEGGEPSTVMTVPRESIPSPSVIMAQFEGNRVMGLGLQSLTTRVAEDGVHVDVTVGSNGIMSREEIEALMWRVSTELAETDPAPVVAHIHYNARHELEILGRNVPAYGYSTFWLCTSDAAKHGPSDHTGSPSLGPMTDAVAHAVASSGAIQSIENEYFTVSADPTTGALSVLDRRTGLVFGPCNVFSDRGDAGDTYTFAPPAVDTTIDHAAAPPSIDYARDEIGSSLTVAQELAVPTSLSADRSARASHTTTIHVTSVVTLTRGCPRVDIRTTVANTAEDHRLRVNFTAPLRCDHVHAEGAFEVVRRPLGAVAMEGAPLEDPVPDAPQHGFVVLHEGDRGLAIAGIGLPEYEAFASDDGSTTVALTLLRCVGWLSRDDLPTRRGGAGPSLPVPEAQCPGTHTFTYSLIPFSGDWQPAIDEAHRAQVPMRAVPVTSGQGDLPSQGSFFRIDAPGVLVSAVKGAEDSQGIVVRLYNVSDDDARGKLHLFRPITNVERLALDERTISTIYSGSPTTDVTITLGPHKIETFRLRG